ncbi:MAG: CvpA family protein [Clostridia bacterium]|nr:CvpA family protein [Clostridia bacterium]
MSIILDVILITILAAFIFTAAKKGFMLTLLELLAVIVALALSYQFSPAVAQATYDSLLEESLIETVETQIDETLNISSTTAQAEVVLESIPDFMASFASSVGVDVEELVQNMGSYSFSSENLATELVGKVAKPIAVGALTVIFFLVLSAILIFALKWVAKLLSKLFKLPLIGTVNKVLGGILGACKGVLVIVFVCTFLELIFASGDSEISNAVNNSYVIGLLDNVNPFIKSLKDIF